MEKTRRREENYFINNEELRQPVNFKRTPTTTHLANDINNPKPQRAKYQYDKNRETNMYLYGPKKEQYRKKNLILNRLCICINF